jgi:hypothetical protein
MNTPDDSQVYVDAFPRQVSVSLDDYSASWSVPCVDVHVLSPLLEGSSVRLWTHFSWSASQDDAIQVRNQLVEGSDIANKTGEKVNGLIKKCGDIFGFNYETYPGFDATNLEGPNGTLNLSVETQNNLRRAMVSARSIK